MLQPVSSLGRDHESENKSETPIEQYVCTVYGYRSIKQFERLAAGKDMHDNNNEMNKDRWHKYPPKV